MEETNVRSSRRESNKAADRAAAKVFSDYVKELRKESDFTAEALSDGLCGRRELTYLESGEREVPMLLQDALLERLGVGAENGEEYYDFEEYDRWEARHRILHNVTFENPARAAELLEAYAEKYDLNDNLENQFYLSQLAQVRRMQGAEREELRTLYEEAVALTVSGAEDRPIREMVLSLKEINLILEREQYRSQGERIERYAEILEYVENRKFDRIGKAKVYPKAVSFLYRSVKQNESVEIQRDWSAKRLLDCCERALEQLRDASRLYFMWEILTMRGELLERRLEEVGALVLETEIGTREYREREQLARQQRETVKWKEALEAVYEEYGVPKETVDYCYLYVKRGVHCISEVIRMRRLMVGMSVQELCDGICLEAAMRNLENRKVKPRRSNVKELFRRLGLPGELKRMELVSSSPEMKRLVEALNIEINNLRWERAEELLAEIEKLSPEDYPVNKQVLMQKALYLQWNREELESEDYCERMRATLELTLPFETFLAEGEKYLTNKEQTCIQNWMQGMDADSEEFKLCIQRFEEYYAPFMGGELQDTESSMFAHIMGYVGSELGNRGDYDAADKYSRQITEGCLRFRRMLSLPNGLYDRWWNYAKRKEEGIPVGRELNGVAELTKCVLLSKLDKQDQRAQFYQDNLEKLKEEGK